MKSEMIRWMIAAAALAVVAGSASAQTYKADIELTFRAGQKVMTPGSYEISFVNRTQNVLLFRNVDSKQSVVLVPVLGDAPKAWREQGKATIAFRCADEGRCELTGMYDGQAQYQYQFRTLTPHGERVAEVIVPIRAD